jgi:hypothetical protein
MEAGLVAPEVINILALYRASNPALWQLLTIPSNAEYPDLNRLSSQRFGEKAILATPALLPCLQQVYSCLALAIGPYHEFSNSDRGLT